MKTRNLLLLTIILILGTSIFPIKIAALMNGNLGDYSLFDSAASGIKAIAEEFEAETNIIEMGYRPSEFEPTLEDLSASGDYELIIVGTPMMAGILQNVAPKYPGVKYILYDASVNYGTGNLSNVYSILYRQNEASFLAGAVAAMTTTDKESESSISEKNSIGFLGGMDVPVINDFLVGYIQGAKYVDPEIKVQVVYAGTWNDSAKGKEFALSMYRQGIDVVFAAAGRTGAGVYLAAAEAGRWAIGVDSDVQKLYENTNPDIVEHILTSVVKNIGVSIYNSFVAYKEDSLEFGKAKSMGIKENTTILADNEYFSALLKGKPELALKLEEITQGIEDGSIVVQTAYGMDESALKAIKDSVVP